MSALPWRENDRYKTNQIVKLLHTHFSERKALAMLYKLENETRELAAAGQRIIALCEEFRERW